MTANLIKQGGTNTTAARYGTLLREAEYCTKSAKEKQAKQFAPQMGSERVEKQCEKRRNGRYLI
jgi:hypothetical protein